MNHHPDVRPPNVTLHSDEPLPALDGLRGIAILLVIPHNTNLITPPFHGSAFLWGHVVQIGWSGVQLFFVLSGFLITGTLIDSKRSAHYYRNFYARRALRIFPLYYAAMLLILVVWPAVGRIPVVLQQTLQNQPWLWIFMTNWSLAFGLDVRGLSHFWSLAVEEQFYLVWPLVVMHCTLRRLLGVCLALGALALIARIALQRSGAAPEWIYMFTFCRMDALAAGAAAAVLLRLESSISVIRRHIKPLCRAAFLLLVAGALATRDYNRDGVVGQTLGHTLLALTFGTIVMAAALAGRTVEWWLTRGLKLAWLRSIGKYSYAMYIIHFPLNVYFGAAYLQHPGSTVSLPTAISYTVAMIIVSYALAYASFHLFEKHFLRLKRFFPTH